MAERVVSGFTGHLQDSVQATLMLRQADATPKASLLPAYPQSLRPIPAHVGVATIKSVGKPCELPHV